MNASQDDKTDKTLDVCGLRPPEPMERVLSALDAMPDGNRLRVLIDREPFPLYAILQRNGYRHRTEPVEDGRYEISIWRGV